MSRALVLQGGSHLLLAADINSVVHERLTTVVDAVRSELRKANIGYMGLDIEGNSVKLKLRDSSAIESARSLLQSITEGMDMTIAPDGAVSASFTDAKINEIAQHAIQQSIEIV